MSAVTRSAVPDRSMLPPDHPILPPAVGRLVRNPAWWMFAVLVILGVWQLAAAFGDDVMRYPRAALLAMVLFALHGAFLIWLLRRIDYLEPEPPALLAAALAWGGLVATSNALRANTAADSILVKLFPPAFVRAWGAAIEGPTNEEILKSLGIVTVILLARRHLNSVMDGVIYGAFVGLGFQEVENVVYALHNAAADNSDTVAPAWRMFLIRGLIGGLWSHAVYSAIAGAGIAYAVLRRDRPTAVRAMVVSIAFAIAWSAHFLWNSPLLTNVLGTADGRLGLLISLLVKGTLVLTALLVIIGVARRHEYRDFARHLSRMDDPTLASPAEIRALRTGRARRTARWNAYVIGGWSAQRATKHIQRHQADLAALMDRVETDPDSAVREHRALATSLHGLRTDRTALGLAVNETAHVAAVDTEPARRTVAGWLSVAAGLASVAFPPAVLLPIGLLTWEVRRARIARRTADPRLLTGLILGVALCGVWLIVWATTAAHIT